MPEVLDELKSAPVVLVPVVLVPVVLVLEPLESPPVVEVPEVEPPVVDELESDEDLFSATCTTTVPLTVGAHATARRANTIIKLVFPAEETGRDFNVEMPKPIKKPFKIPSFKEYQNNQLLWRRKLRCLNQNEATAKTQITCSLGCVEKALCLIGLEFLIIPNLWI